MIPTPTEAYELLKEYNSGEWRISSEAWQDCRLCYAMVC